jgi:hypothetical protein
MDSKNDLEDKNVDHVVDYIEDDLVKDYRHNLNAQIRNPLTGLTETELDSQAAMFCEKYGFNEDLQLFQQAARVAQKPESFEDMPSLTEDDKYYLRRETTREQDHP